ncbi:MAG: hypothetical protein L3J77_01420 [Thermoplasmata archaeon]|nr:hypothetical protein [Thermoplasmata archaeon]
MNPTGRAPGGLTVSIVRAPSTVDSGVDVTLTGTALGGDPPYTPEWSVGIGTLESGWSIQWTTPSVAGSLLVLFEVRDRANVVATTTATIHVVPGPFLELSGPGVLGDVGLPLLFTVNVSGGVGPFSVHWSSVNGPSNGSATVPVDGVYTGAVVPDSAGPVWVTGSVVDAWNRSSSGTAPVGRATAPPSLTPTSVPFAEVGYPTPVSVGVADGTPPFTWSVPAVAGVSDQSTSGGTLGADGIVAFSVTFDHGGNFSLPIQVVDAAGAVDATNVTVTVAGGLNVTVSLGSPMVAAGQPVDIVASIGGGLPPYAYRFALSDDEETSGNVSVAGPVRWVATPAASGYLTLRGSVTDGTGRTANVTVTLYVAPPSPGTVVSVPGADGSGPAAVAGAVAGVALALVGGFVVRRWWRWPLRRPSPTPPGQADRAVVRELLAEADDGMDRATLELLAEERQLSSAAVAAALTAWQRAGRVRVEEADDGREVVRWVSPSGGGAAVPASSPGPAPPEEAP